MALADTIKKLVDFAAKVNNAVKSSGAGVESNPSSGSSKVETNPSRNMSGSSKKKSNTISTPSIEINDAISTRPVSPAPVEFNTAPANGQGIVTNPGTGATGQIIEKELEQVTPEETITPDYIRKMNEAKLQNRINAAKKAFNSRVSSLDEEEAKIKPMFYDARNREAAQSDIAAANFAQYMAARGIKGSAGAMPEMNRLNALQGNLGKLDRQENEIIADIARRRSLAEAELDSDIARAEYESEAELMAALIDQANKDREYNSRVEQYEDEQTARQKAEYLDTIGRFSDDYQAEINRVQNDGDPTNDWQIPYLQAARQQKIAGQNLADLKAQEEANRQEAEKKKAEEEKAQQLIDNAMKLWQMYGVADKYISEILGVPVGAKTANYNISLQNADTARQNASKSSDKVDYASNYNEAVQTFSGINPDTGKQWTAEEIADNLASNASGYISMLSAPYFNNLLTNAQNQYFQEVLNRWRGNYSGLKVELQRLPDYYKRVLGIENYNKLMSL